MTIKHVIFGIILLVLLGLYVALAEAQDCNFFGQGDLISDVTVPYPNSSHCDGNGEIRFVCGHVEATAYVAGYFYIVGDYDTEVSFEFYLYEGQSRSYSIPKGVEWLQLWYGQDLVGIVDVVQSDCSGVVYPPDDRVNWQAGDSFYAVYLEGGIVYVYGLETGVGELIFASSQPACTEDDRVCLYQLEDGTYQLNLLDPEGKLYEIPIAL